jgi:hypothetical protein
LQSMVLGKTGMNWLILRTNFSVPRIIFQGIS